MITQPIAIDGMWKRGGPLAASVEADGGGGGERIAAAAALAGEEEGITGVLSDETRWTNSNNSRQPRRFNLAHVNGKDFIYLLR